MLPLLLVLLSLLCGGSLQQDPGYKLQVQESVTVQEGLCVLVPCSFSYPETRTSWTNPGRTFIFWFRDGDNTDYGAPVATNKPYWPVRPETKGRFHIPSDLSTNNCSLRITDARREDTGTYFLRVEKGSDVKYNYIQKKLSMEVTGVAVFLGEGLGWTPCVRMGTEWAGGEGRCWIRGSPWDTRPGSSFLPLSSALTEKPHIQLPAPLQSGHTTELHCSLPGHCPEGRSLRFSWKGSALDSQTPWRVKSSLLLTPRPQDHNTNLNCLVQYPGGQVTTERTVQLNVSYPPQNLSVSVFFHDSTVPRALSNGTSLRLVCMADGNPPASMGWFKGHEALPSSRASASGVLELPEVRAEDGGELTCWARHLLGSRHFSLNLSVQRASSGCTCLSDREESSWPLVLTLIRGSLMAAGFLLTYGLTWLYYTRCGGPRIHPSTPR
ncbi:sialic acid-binding Ig-like lectin 14 [Ochotona princeps]|uniref:sialic acid-binding Ig-like lectin 14 n=1 Tax=Ochotona princeps TaxID=9978 RepID=UPI002714E6CD|nr:sialic acid-binding Ig-like lectin 14 [Ochotona princeps]